MKLINERKRTHLNGLENCSEGQHHWLDNAFRNILFYVKTVPWDNYPRLLWFLNLTKLS